MTIVATEPSTLPHPPRAVRAPLGVALAVGLSLGLLLGIAARLWMRVITKDPNFSWAGTLFIVAAFGLFGVGQALSWSARRSDRRWRRRLARGLGVVLTLPLFTGAGSIMLPTVFGAALACWRTDWRAVLRLIPALLAVPAVVMVVSGIPNEMGWGLRALAGIAGFVAIYGIVIAALGATIAPLAGRQSRRSRRRSGSYAGGDGHVAPRAAEHRTSTPAA